MLDSLNRKVSNYFCDICGNHATHVLIDKDWHCCCCFPTLLPDPELIGFNIAEAMSLAEQRLINKSGRGSAR